MKKSFTKAMTAMFGTSITGQRRTSQPSGYYPVKASRHQNIDIQKLRKRRAKNKMGRKTRQIQRKRAHK